MRAINGFIGAAVVSSLFLLAGCGGDDARGAGAGGSATAGSANTGSGGAAETTSGGGATGPGAGGSGGSGASTGSGGDASVFEPTPGLFALLATDAMPAPTLFTTDSVTGLAVRTAWSTNEPSDGVFDWSYLDHQIQAAKSAGKKVSIYLATSPTGSSPPAPTASPSPPTTARRTPSPSPGTRSSSIGSPSSSPPPARATRTSPRSPTCAAPAKR
jgi:Beta-galactosidase